VEWDCRVHSLTLTVFADGDSVYAKLPGECPNFKERKLSRREAMMRGKYYRKPRPSLLTDTGKGGENNGKTQR
jgi:hypothetical protein